jgi:DNA-binding GntR family transcriptional regulator
MKRVIALAPTWLWEGDASRLGTGAMEFRTKQDYVAETLRERIISGLYARGAKLKQLDIAHEFGLSSTPVREALRILEAEGFVEARMHQGVVVPEFNIDQAEELLRLRILLELELTEAAMAHFTPEKLQELRAIQDVYDQAFARKDPTGLRTGNYRFHFRLYELAERPQTLAFVRVLWAKYPFHFLDAIQDRSLRVADEHHSILAALESGDTAAVLTAMKHHIRAGWNEYIGSQLRGK